MRLTDKVGQRFGRLVVVSRAPGRGVRQRVRWMCRCDCGESVSVVTEKLGKRTNSCGCFRVDHSTSKATVHGMSKSREYHSWSGAKSRCENAQSPAFARYGGRGIRMCERWRISFASFFQDMGPCPPGMSLDRIDVDGDYAPGNCRWATSVEQAGNKRLHRLVTFRGKTRPVTEWARITGIPEATIRGRLNLGWSDRDSVTVPIRRNRRWHHEPDQFVSGAHLNKLTT